MYYIYGGNIYITAKRLKIITNEYNAMVICDVEIIIKSKINA